MMKYHKYQDLTAEIMENCLIGTSVPDPFADPHGEFKYKKAYFISLYKYLYRYLFYFVKA
jgi:hypothetical protein